MNLLIIGSNFGLNHCKAAIKSKKFKHISICSPNVYSKKNLKSITKYDNFKIAIDQNNFDMISIATTPKVQNEILNYFLKKKIFPKLLLLEKPLLDDSIKVIKKFPKDVLFLTNFIFSFEKNWTIYKKKINKTKKKIISFEYQWLFKQAYFVNKKKTWKIKAKSGGGLINYYLPHAIFNIINIYKNVKFKRIGRKILYNRNPIYLELIFSLNREKSKLIISNKSNENKHLLNTNFNQNNLLLENNTRKWLSNFKIFLDGKKIFTQKKIVQKDSRLNTLVNIYSNLKFYFSKNYVARNKFLTYKTFKIIKHINTKLK